jgi:hypothetical protein
MTLGPYRRLTGKVRLNGRSPMLETADQTLIRLRTSDDLAPFSGFTVVVEGSLRHPGLLDVIWIGPPSENAPD